jgi:hypothetical protein
MGRAAVFNGTVKANNGNLPSNAAYSSVASHTVELIVRGLDLLTLPSLTLFQVGGNSINPVRINVNNDGSGFSQLVATDGSNNAFATISGHADLRIRVRYDKSGAGNLSLETWLYDGTSLTSNSSGAVATLAAQNFAAEVFGVAGHPFNTTQNVAVHVDSVRWIQGVVALGSAPPSLTVDSGLTYYERFEFEDNLTGALGRFNLTSSGAGTITYEDSPGGPAAPVLTLGTISGRSITLTAPAVTGATSIKVYRKTGVGGTYALAKTVSGNTLNYTDTAPAYSTTFYYKAIASNSGGDSPDSNEVNGTTGSEPAVIANAGPDRTILAGETIVLDGSGSSGYYDGLQPDGKHSVRWDFGYSGFTAEMLTQVPTCYPEPGVYTVTLTVYNDVGHFASDTATVTVSAIDETGPLHAIHEQGSAAANLAALQSAIAVAASENNPVIIVDAGMVLRGSIQLPNRTGSGYLTIKSSQASSLPGPLSRVAAADESNMFVWETDPAVGSARCITTPSPSASPAHHYRIIGAKFRKGDETVNTVTSFIQLGNGETSISQLPHHFLVDRCAFDGGALTSSLMFRAIHADAADVSVMNSRVYRIKHNSQDAQALLTIQGLRQTILNNYLEATGECTMTGGNDTTISGHNPQFFCYRRNHYKKDLGWFANAASYGGAYYGVNYTVKNLFEFKTMVGAVVQGNRFEAQWEEDQKYALTLTVRDQSGGAPQAKVDYLDVSYNEWVDIDNWCNILAQDDMQQSDVSTHLLLRHNVVRNLGKFGGTGWFLHNNISPPAGTVFTYTDPGRLHVVNNTAPANTETTRGFFFDADVAAHRHWIHADAINNIVANGFIMSIQTPNTTYQGDAAVADIFSDALVAGNVFHGSTAAERPSGSSSTATVSGIGFTSYPTNLQLSGSSAFLASGVGGSQPGANFTLLTPLTLHTVDGVWAAGAAAPPQGVNSAMFGPIRRGAVLTIQSGQTTSNGVQIPADASELVGIVVGPGATTADLTIQSSWDNGATFASVKKSDGTTVIKVTGATANSQYGFDQNEQAELQSVGFIRILSSVAQTSGVTVYILIR